MGIFDNLFGLNSGDLCSLYYRAGLE